VNALAVLVALGVVLGAELILLALLLARGVRESNE
jgi:hypothetical protein